jgi:vancomycin resistance protein YoaR
MYHPVYQMKQKKKLQKRKKVILQALASFFWFITGAAFAAFLFISFTFFTFKNVNSDVVYPGITVDNINVGRWTETGVREMFAKKNETMGDINFTFSLDTMVTSISAKDLKIGYDQDLIARQAMSLGRSKNFLSNISIVSQAYFEGLNLQPAYHYSEDKLNKALAPIMEKVNKEPVDALFNFQNGKVITFKPSEEGKMIDMDQVKKDLIIQFENTLSKPNQIQSKQESQQIIIPITVKTILPKITTDKANNLGIKELIGKGTSLFHHSIPNRVFNVNLAASRINGVLIAPNETFSFDKALGDVSAFTGYQQAYVIQNGKTVLGDGGGVCQVSTTFFRAILEAGLPIIERHAHAYRVGYYEQDGPPGLDATIYAPSVDLKFKNDTNNYILAQTQIDQESQRLTVFLYGALDGRSVILTQPIISNRTPAPPDLYQDDPTLQKGIIKQVDFSAEGSTISFSRTVTKNGKKIISENFISNYAPWQSVFLRGTKE